MSRFDTYYVLNGHEVVEADFKEWVQMWKDPESRRVAQTDVGDANVSTVFLGMDHNWGDGPPVLFETMIFGGEHNENQWRWRTWDEAENGHRLIVEALQAGTDPWDSVNSA